MKKIVSIFMLITSSASFAAQEDLNKLFNDLNQLRAAATGLTTVSVPPAAIAPSAADLAARNNVIQAMDSAPIDFPNDGTYEVSFCGVSLRVTKTGDAITIVYAPSKTNATSIDGGGGESKVPPAPQRPAPSAKDLQGVQTLKPIRKGVSRSDNGAGGGEAPSSKPKLTFLEEIAAKAQAKEEAAGKKAAAVAKETPSAAAEPAAYPIINTKNTQVTFKISRTLDLKNGLITRDKMEEIDESGWGLEQEENTKDGVQTVTFILDNEEYKWDGEPYNLKVKKQDDSADNDD